MSWDERLLSMAHLAASWSKDPSTKVGAVIADPMNRIVSVGYNGFPRGIEDDVNVDRDEKLRRTIHAEENALLFAGRSVEGCTIFITHPPCSQCAAKVIQSGIKRVVYVTNDEVEKRWAAYITSGYAMLEEAGVEMTPYTV